MSHLLGRFSVHKTVLMAGIYHETHTFLHEKTGLVQFRDMVLNLGEEVIKINLGNGSPTDGFLSYAISKNWEIIPTIQMAAMPSGTVEDEALDFFKAHFFEALETHCQAIDGIFLVLHGAMVSETCDDVEGELLCEIQQFMTARGINIPVVGVLDLHANVSQQMLDESTCLYAYRENPHNDARDAAVRAAELLDEVMDQPGVQHIHLGTKYVIPPVGLATSKDPMKAIEARAREIEAATPEILCINVMGGYAYADIADCGFSLNCCTRGDPATAEGFLMELLRLLETHLLEAYPVESSLENALEHVDQNPPGAGPVLLIEPADNIGGGTPGDATGILEPLLTTKRCGIVAIINDPEAASACHKLQLGQSINLQVGAKTDDHHGAPIAFSGTIESLSDGRFELENKNSHLASMMGTHIDMGPCAVISNAKARILLTSRKTPPMDLGQLHSQGIRPEDADFVIVKAAVSHKDAYDPIAARSYYIDSPGLCTSNLERLPYRKLSGKVISLARSE